MPWPRDRDIGAGRTLADLQRRFLAALATDADDTQLLARIDARAPGAARRLAVYRNNRSCQHRATLRATFPVVERLVGGGFFTWLADSFSAAVPSRSGNLDDYGGEFPAFIDAFPAARTLPYLGDVARLEWLLDAIWRAPDTTVDTEYTLDSPYPLQRIWQVNQADWQADTDVSLAEGGGLVRITRCRLPDADGYAVKMVTEPWKDE